MLHVKKLSAFAILLLLLQLCLATEIDYESSSAARIIGETPKDMQDSLNVGSGPIASGSYYTSIHSIFGQDVSDLFWQGSAKTRKLLQQEYGSSLDSPSGWDWSYLNSSVANWNNSSGKKLFVLQTPGKIENGKLVMDSFSSKVSAGQTNWESGFDKSKPLFVADVPQGGIYLPKSFNAQNSLVGKYLSRSTAIIAPTAGSNEEIVRAFICSLALYSPDLNSLGERYRNARNNFKQYYDNTALEAFFSYNYYGSPSNNSVFPMLWGEGSEIFKGLCDEYATYNSLSQQSMSLQEFTETISDLGDGKYRMLKENIFSSYSTEIINGFDLLKVEGTIDPAAATSLFLPKRVEITRFPLMTLITDVNLVEMSDPVDLTLNIPSYDNNSFAGRICSDNNKEAGILLNHSFTEDKEQLIMEVNPIEIVDCNQGLFRLYRKVVYSVEYNPYSPILLDAQAPEKVLPRQEIDVKITAKAAKTGSHSGLLRITDGNSIIAEQPVTVDGQNLFAMKIYAPDEEGPYSYLAEFLQDGNVMTLTYFNFEVELVRVSLETRVKEMMVFKPRLPHIDEDFEDGDYTSNPAWSVGTKGDATIVNENNPATSGSYSLKLTTGDDMWVTISVVPDSDEYSMWMKVSSTSSSNSEMRVYDSADPSYFLGINIHKQGTNPPRFQYLTNSVTEAPISEQDPEAGAWHKFVIQYTIGSATANFLVYNADGSLRASAMGVRVPSPLARVNTIKLEQENGGYETYYDDVSWTSTLPEYELSNVGTATLSIENEGSEPLSLDLSHYLLKENSIKQDGNYSSTVNPHGLNAISFSYDDLNRQDSSYSVIAGLAYNGRVKIISGSIVTNSPPLIQPIQEISTNAGHIVEIIPLATDDENDAISYTISEPVGNDGIWQTDAGNEGDYNVTITASDGLLSSSSVVKVHVGAPVIDCNVNFDCGTDAFVQERVCPEDGKMVNVYRKNICNMAGTIYSTCSTADENVEIGKCGIASKFSDGSDKAILDFDALGSKTIYLSLPKNAKVKEAAMDVAGFEKQGGCFYDDFSATAFHQQNIDAPETNASETDRFFPGNYYYTLPFSGTVEAASQTTTRDMLYWNIPTTIASPTIGDSGVAGSISIYGNQWTGQHVWRVFIDLSCDNMTSWTDHGPYFQSYPQWYALPFGDSPGELCRLTGGNGYALNWHYNFSPPPSSTSSLWGIWTGSPSTSQPAYIFSVNQFAPEAKVVSQMQNLQRVKKIYLNADERLYGNDAIEYYVSSGNGSTWIPISNGQWITLPEVKQENSLRWKAVLKSTHRAYAPRLFDMNLCYETVAPTTNPKMDLGNDSLLEWMHEGAYSGLETTSDLSAKLNEYLANYPGTDGNVLIPITVSSDSEGELILQNLEIKYVTEERMEPSIISYSPDGNQTIREGESKAFSITAFDPNNDLLAYSWFVGGNNTNESSGSFVYSANYDSAGVHEIKAVVSDGNLEASHYWLLDVVDVPLSKIKPKKDALDGYINYKNGAYYAVSSPSLNNGHYSDNSNYYWRRTVMDFSIAGRGKVNKAMLSLDYLGRNVKNENCIFDLYSITTLGGSIDKTDWNSIEFEKVKDNWFDQNISNDVNVDITTAWNNAVKAGRNYIAFRIGMDSEASYTSKTNYCQVYFRDTNSGGIDPYIEYSPSGENSPPVILSYSPVIDPTIKELQKQAFSITKIDPDNNPLTVTWYLDGKSVLTNNNSYTFSSGLSSAGDRNVTVVVSDGNLSVSHEWHMTVIDVPAVKARSDSFDGYIQYKNGAYYSTTSSSIYSGHYSDVNNFYWKRAVMDFNLSGIGKVSKATLFLDYISKNIKNEACLFDLYSTLTLGSSIDKTDWNSAIFEKVKDNWFDQSLSKDINADVTAAWNNAIDANRAYIALRIAMDNDTNYTSKSNYCQFYFYDTGAGGVDPYISYVK